MALSWPPSLCLAPSLSLCVPPPPPPPWTGDHCLDHIVCPQRGLITVSPSMEREGGVKKKKKKERERKNDRQKNTRGECQSLSPPLLPTSSPFSAHSYPTLHPSNFLSHRDLPPWCAQLTLANSQQRQGNIRPHLFLLLCLWMGEEGMKESENDEKRFRGRKKSACEKSERLTEVFPPG